MAAVRGRYRNGRHFFSMQASFAHMAIRIFYLCVSPPIRALITIRVSLIGSRALTRATPLPLLIMFFFIKYSCRPTVLVTYVRYNSHVWKRVRVILIDCDLLQAVQLHPHTFSWTAISSWTRWRRQIPKKNHGNGSGERRTAETTLPLRWRGSSRPTPTATHRLPHPPAETPIMLKIPLRP